MLNLEDYKYLVINNPKEDTVLVSTGNADKFISTLADLARAGYTYVEGTASLYMPVKQASFLRPEGEAPATPVADAPEDVLTEAPTEAPAPLIPTALDDAYIDSLKGTDGAKLKLETYGKEFNIDLKRNKSFDNMAKSLREHVNSK